MLDKVKKFLTLTTLLGLLVATFAFAYPSSTASAVDVLNGAEGPCSNGAGSASVCNSNGASGGNPIYGEDGILTKAIRIISIVIGVLAIIMIIVSAFRMVVSAGDANAVSGARNTLIYALVGLAVAAFGTILVEFVLSKVGGG